jgi:hypothetical protein
MPAAIKCSMVVSFHATRAPSRCRQQNLNDSVISESIPITVLHKKTVCLIYCVSVGLCKLNSNLLCVYFDTDCHIGSQKVQYVQYTQYQVNTGNGLPSRFQNQLMEVVCQAPTSLKGKSSCSQSHRLAVKKALIELLSY